MISIKISGEEINEIFIITSLMSENTPESFIDFINIGDETYYLLNYSIQEGHNQTSNINLIGIIFSLIITMFFKFVRKKKRKGINWSKYII